MLSTVDLTLLVARFVHIYTFTLIHCNSLSMIKGAYVIYSGFQPTGNQFSTYRA